LKLKRNTQTGVRRPRPETDNRFSRFRHRAEGQRLHAIEIEALDGRVAGLRFRNDSSPNDIPGQLLHRARRIRIVADEIAAAVAEPDERPHQLDVGVRRGGVPAVCAAAGGGAVVPEPLRVPLQIALGQFECHATAHTL
jgi:hypothetical protein